ncbi:four helix bundle protein [Phaeocystidibacter luteus]|uniref:Four helix bundle protein n=1 Tax=Phaeocystidibacter luteus TaxID=911197 RepID=A0A6N6RKR8_9FLAO|nr:four helix bundle protein [Phaeocystidibacter luteus]KAB2808673.1 four helix bundle protein [Phaeocystidibacter luteus]
MKHNYQRLKVYHSSMELARECYDIDAVDKGKQLADHIFKTSFSVPSNIAEGSQRKTNADFLRFLNYSAS